VSGGDGMSLFKPAWMSRFQGRAVRAVEKLTDHEEIARAAIEAQNFIVRLIAINKLTNQSVLAKVAKCDSDSGVRYIAAIGLYRMLLSNGDNNDSLMDVVRFFGDRLEKSDSEVERKEAADILTSLYRQYQRNEICEYDGSIITVGENDHSDCTTDGQWHYSNNYSDGGGGDYDGYEEGTHTDSHSDTRATRFYARR
jgi:hypothetical protein